MSPAQPSYSTIQHFWRALRGCLGHLTFVRSAAILAVALALAMPMRASAQSLAIGSSVGAPGGQAVVTLSFSGEDIHHLQLDIDYDATALSPTSVTAGQGLVDHLLDWAVLTPGVLRVVVYSASCVEPASGPASRFEAARAELATGELLLIAWEIAQDADLGTYPLMPGAAVLSTAEGAPLTAALEPGSVEVTDAVSVVEIPTLQEWGLIGLCLLLFGTGVWVLRRDASVAIAASLVVLMITQSSLAQAPPGSIDAPMVEEHSERGSVPGSERLAAPATASIPGDADADGTLSTADVWLIVDSILGRGTPPGDPDCNEDGVVDVLDVACVVAVYCADGGPGNLPPALAAISDSSVREREVVAFTATASDPDLPDDTLTWTLTQRPVGATLDKERGTLLWVPTGDQVGTHPFTVQVTDAEGLSDQETFVVTVRDLGGPPVLDTIPEQSVVEGNPLALTANATDPDLPEDDLTYSLTLAPAGMAIEPSNGAISWTPSSSEVGMHDVTVQVSDREGLLDFTSFVATVQGMNEAPVARDDVYEARLGEPLAVVVPGVLGNDSDPNGDPLTALLQDDAAEGALTLTADGHFDYLLEPPDRTTPVELELLCENTVAGGSEFQTNGTVTVGDVDNDGDIEIVGTWDLSGYTFLAEVWIMNAADCSEQAQTGAVVEQAGGFGFESHLGLLDIDGDGDLEIIGTRNRHPVAEGGASDDEHLLAVHHDGTLAWPGNGGSETSAILGPDTSVGSNNLGYRYAGPTFADLDADGSIEIVMPFSIGSGFSVFSGVVAYNAEDGSIAWEFLSSFRQGGGNDQKVSYVADLDLDGTMEVIVHNSVVDHEGALEFELPSQPSIGTSTAGHLTLAIANFDDDAFPELIGRDQFNHYLFEHDGTLTWKQAERNQSEGQITVADLDGDGEPEWAYVTCGNYGFGCDAYFLVAYEADGSVLWSHEDEPSLHVASFWEGSVNATAFDANRDGAFDLVFRNDTVGIETLFIFDGRDGSVLESVPAKKYSGQQRFVTIADVNGDGHAELITSYSGGLEGQTAVWTGTAANPLPAAPAFRNQWIFNEAYVDDDLSIPTNPLPHWLQPGRNGFHTITREPDPLIGTTDSFTYVAHDGALASNLATVTLDILPAGNPPRFLSEPDTLTTRGFDYRYLPRVVDPDLGDTVTFRLTAGPAGMTLDPVIGEVRWQPDTNGTFDVTILALDTIGFATAQEYVLTVGEPVVVPDVVGLPEATAESALTAENLVIGTKRAATHPTVPAGAVASQTPIAGSVAEFGGAVDVVVSLGPAPEDVDDDGDGLTENEGDCDDADAAILPGASDPAGDGVDQDCDGFDGEEPVSEIVIEPATLTLLEGERRQLTAYAIFADGTSQIATGIVTWASFGPATATVSANGLLTAVADTGPAVITATRDAVVGTADVTVTDRDAADDEAPSVNITAPAEGDSVFGPVDVTGTATDPNLVRYDLAISPAGEETFTPMGGGTAPVAGGVLGQLDPTLMLNGLYTLRLTVLDAGGNQTLDEVVVQVDGQQKVGNFSLTFEDLRLPGAGIPISVSRTYDSRDKRLGDFGIGWRLSLRTLEVRCSEGMGEGWFVGKSGLAYGLVPTRSHRCSLRLPNGELEAFELVPRPESSAIVPFSFLTVSFEPLPGTIGELRALDNTNLLIADPQPGPVALLDDTTLATFDPQRFAYVTGSGTEFILSVAQGLERVEDVDGNVLTIGAGGITHSSGTAAILERDAEGRIVAVVDALGRRQSYLYSASGDLISHTDREGNVTRFFYDLRHGLLRVEDPLGNRAIRNEFDDEGRRVALIDAEGNRTEFLYDDVARTMTIRNPEGHETTVAYDERGNVERREASVTVDGVPTVATTTYEYDAEGNETAVVDGDGVRVEQGFSEGEVTSIVVDPGGLDLARSFSYDAEGRLTGSTDEMGRATTFAYDSRENPVEADGPGAVDLGFAYGSTGGLVGVTDPTGRRDRFEYTAAGQIAVHEVLDASGLVLSRSESVYDANGKLLSRTEMPLESGASPRTTSFTYDANGRLIAVTGPEGGGFTREYDASGNLVSQTDALGNRTERTYDPRGLPIAIERPDGSSESFEYDALGRLVRETDGAGVVTEMEYDELGRQIAKRRDGALVGSRVYSAAGRLMAEVDPTGARTDYERDSAGRVTKVVLPEVIDGTTASPAHPEVLQERNAAGLFTAFVDPTGRRSEIEYDAEGRPFRFLHSDGTFREQTFDAAGRVKAVSDELGNVTEYEYDGAGRLVSVILPPPGSGEPRPVTRYAYDAHGNLRTQTDALGRTTAYYYDDAGRPERRVLPDGSVQTTSYDVQGQPVRLVDFDGTVLDFAYDPLGRLVSRSSSTGLTETLTYTSAGYRASVTDARGTSHYAYDSRGRLASITEPDGAVIAYSYDDANRITRTNANGRAVDYTYDALGRLASVSSPEGSTAYTYDLAGRVVRTTLPNGVVSDAAYDARGLLTELEHRSAGTVLDRFVSTYDPSGRRTGVAEADGSLESYGYDGLGRLVSANRLGSSPFSVAYEYDAVGNRIRQVQNGVETLYTYDTNDRLVAATAADFTYDGRGNRSSGVAEGVPMEYRWDAFGRLESVSRPEGTTRFAYDVDDRRVGRQGPGGDVRYLVDTRSPGGFDEVVEERTPAGTRIAAYTHGLGLLSQSRGGGSAFYGHDHHGSVRFLTDTAGVVTDRYDYLPFGSLASTSGTTTNSFRFAGERFEEAALAYDLRQRSYDPGTGVFLSRDPYPGTLEVPFSRHPYQYADADPIGNVDPLGLFTLPEISISQTVQNGVKNIKLAVNVGKSYCKAKGTLKVVRAVSIGSQLAAGAFAWTATPGAGKFLDKLAVEFPLGAGKNEDKLVVEVNPDGNLLTGSVKKVEFKVEVDSNGSKVSANATFDDQGGWSFGGGGAMTKEVDLLTLEACGVDIAELSLAMEGSVSTGFSHKGGMVGGGLKGALKLGFATGEDDAEADGLLSYSFGDLEYGIFEVQGTTGGLSGNIFGYELKDIFGWK